MIITSQIVIVAYSSCFGIVLFHNLIIRKVEKSSSVYRLKLPIFPLANDFLRKHEFLNLFRMGNRQGNFHVQGTGFSPRSVFHSVTFDFLISADANIIADEADFFGAVRYQRLFFAQS